MLACLSGLAGRKRPPKPAAAALAEIVRRCGLERAGEALIRWAHKYGGLARAEDKLRRASAVRWESATLDSRGSLAARNAQEGSS